MGNETTSGGEAWITSNRDHKSGGHYHPTAQDSAAPFAFINPCSQASVAPEGKRGGRGGESRWEKCILREERGIYFRAGRFLQPSIKVRGHQRRRAHRKGDILASIQDCVSAQSDQRVYGKRGEVAGGATTRRNEFCCNNK